MKYPIALFCSLCMLLLWAACDSQGGKFDQECLGDVTLLSALEDTTAYVGESLTLKLGGDHLAFKQTAGRHMTYAADSDEPFINVEIADQAVQVTASQTGEAQIRVQAVDECGQQAEAIFTVRFLDPCSPSAPSGEVSFMPVQVGDSWKYAYHNYSRVDVGWSDVVADTGQVHLTAIAATCNQGQRLMTLRQEIQVKRWSWRAGSEEDTVMTQIEEEQEVQLIEYEDGRVLHPFATEPFMRFHPAIHDTVQVDGGEVRLLKAGCSGGDTMSLMLTKDQGIVAARFRQCLGSVAVSNSGRLELVEAQ